MEKKKNTIYTQYVYFHTLKILKAFPSSSMCAVRKKKKVKAGNILWVPADLIGPAHLGTIFLCLTCTFKPSSNAIV